MNCELCLTCALLQIECSTAQDGLGTSSECFSVASLGLPHCGEILCKCFKAIKSGPGIGSVAVRDCLERMCIDYAGMATSTHEWSCKVKLTQFPVERAEKLYVTSHVLIKLGETLHFHGDGREPYRFKILLDMDVCGVPLKRYATALYDYILGQTKLQSLYAKVTVLGSMTKVISGLIQAVQNKSALDKLKEHCMWPRITDDPNVLATFMPSPAVGNYEPQHMVILRDERFGKILYADLCHRAGVEVVNRFLSEKESARIAEFAGPCFDTAVADTYSNLQSMYRQVVDRLYRNKNKHYELAMKMDAHERKIRELRAEVLGKPVNVDSAIDAMAFVEASSSVLAALSAGAVKGLAVPAGVLAADCGGGKGIASPADAGTAEAARFVLTVEYDRPLWTLEHDAERFKELRTKSAPDLQSIYARTAWRAVKGKGVPGEVTEFKKLPKDVAVYVWAVPGV